MQLDDALLQIVEVLGVKVLARDGLARVHAHGDLLRSLLVADVLQRPGVGPRQLLDLFDHALMTATRRGLGAARTTPAFPA